MMKRVKIFLLPLSIVLIIAGCTPPPSPSTAITNHRSYNLQNSTPVVIADLASQNSDDSNHQITIATESRIMITAQINIDNPAGIAVRGACSLFISDGTGTSNGLTPIGRSAVWYTNDNPAYDLTVTVVGATTKPPGTYNIVVQSTQLGVAGGTTATLDNMVVWTGSK